MVERPEVDGRRRRDLREHVEELAPYYVDEWDPASDDVASALVELFAELAADVIERLDYAPEKHRVAFFDELGFERRPARPATCPVAFEVAEGADRNVAIESGTEVLAPERDGRPEVSFRVADGDGFEATPARCREVYSVNPTVDGIYSHARAIDGEAESTLFAGENRQLHALYVGHPDELAISSDSTLAVDLETTTPEPFERGDVTWEYYGEKPVGDRDAAAEEADVETVEGWHEFDAVDPVSEGGRVSVELSPDGPLLETTENGVECYWIRLRESEGRRSSRPPVLELREVTFAVRSGSETNSSLVPDALLAADVPQSADDESCITPFGDVPRRRDAFYVACEEAFTKAGATVWLRFEWDDRCEETDASEPADEDVIDPHGDPRLSWEYWNGDGWSRLEGVADGTNAFRRADAVEFTVPSDLEPTTVAGHDGHWIRVRLVDGEYVTTAYDERTGELGHDGDYPRYGAIEVEYSSRSAPARVFAFDNLEYADRGDPSSWYRVFEALPDDDQAVYLGFDGPLRDGPIQLLLDVTDREYPEWFAPRVRWEYCVDVERDEWTRLPGTDGSDGFTERGLVSLAFPEETTSFDRFGRDRHWIRARVRGTPFEPTDADSSAGGGFESRFDHRESRASPCRAVLETMPPAGRPTVRRPTVRGIYPNAGVASNVTVVDEEIVGSSDGSPNQSFAVDRPPLVDEAVWVDELQTLSDRRRDSLQEDRPEDVDVVTRTDGTIRECWVRWAAVDDLRESGPDDRHYVVDRVDGTITFGDGDRARIPASGRDNVRVSYRSGGGPDGNVRPGEITDLKGSIPLVDGVSNPVAGAGGAETETTRAVLERAPKTLRDRGRAVAPADFERIAMDASRRLAAARCVPGMDRAGERAPGWVTLLIVPDDRRRKPAPSAGLKRQIHRAVADRAPATLVADDRLVVRGPSYVAVGVEAVVVADDGARVGALEGRLHDRLADFLHPLSGGERGEGWSFGALPTVGDAFALLEGCDGVDHVESLVLRFDGNRGEVAVAEGDPSPTTAADALVHSGAHDLVVTPRDRPERPMEGS